jgi:hypothetical protein
MDNITRKGDVTGRRINYTVYLDGVCIGRVRRTVSSNPDICLGRGATRSSAFLASKGYRTWSTTFATPALAEAALVAAALEVAL